MAYQASLGVVALTRFGYGPRGDGDAAIAAGDPRGFLRAELMQPGIALLSGAELPVTKVAIQQFFGDRARRKEQKEKLAVAQAMAAAQTPAPDAALFANTPGRVADAMRQASVGLPARATQPAGETNAGKEVKAQNA